MTKKQKKALLTAEKHLKIGIKYKVEAERNIERYLDEVEFNEENLRQANNLINSSKTKITKLSK